MTLPEKIKHYGLTQKDWFQHKHYTILTRMGIDKIQAIEKINISYEAIVALPEFCVVKAIGTKEELVIETFGSAKYGGKEWNAKRNNGKGGWDEFGNTTTWYVMEMAEKRAMSRVVLKITGFYELGVFGEDESEDFKNETTKPPKTTTKKPPKTTTAEKQVLVKDSKEWKALMGFFDDGKVTKLTQITKQYKLSPELTTELTNKITELNN
jgi:hypothetical protein